MIIVLLSGCGAARTVQQVVEDVEDAFTGTRGAYTVRLDRWLESIPPASQLRVARDEDDSVYLVTEHGEQLLGKLTYQMPDTPIKTMFLDIGTDKLVLGRVDDTLPGRVDSVTIDDYSPPEAEFPMKLPAKTIVVDANGYYFFFPIYENEWPAWQRLGYLYISTHESLQRALEGETKLPFKKVYAPYFDIADYLVPIAIRP
ncbi:MAG: hypothetical protein U0X20_19285 [Caldilineaceae bacterium]